MAEDPYVQVYDPANPGEPARVLRANFDPRRHVRWEQRPGVQAVDFRAAVGLNAKEAKALREAEIVTLADVLKAKPKDLKEAVGAEAAKAIVDWKDAHPHLSAVKAERERSRKKEPEAVDAEDLLPAGSAPIYVPLAADLYRDPHAIEQDVAEVEAAAAEHPPIGEPVGTTPPSGDGPGEAMEPGTDSEPNAGDVSGDPGATG